MKVLFLCGKEPSYIRNVMMLKGLRNCGCEIVDCSDTSGTYLLRFVNALISFYASNKKDISFVFIGCLGHHLFPFIRNATSLPIIFDPFVSMYDTMCLDRKKYRPDSMIGKLLYWLDTYAYKHAEIIMLDTEAHIDYFTKTFNVPRERFHRIFVGADESVFYPRDITRDDNRFRVFYYSSYLPLHGTEYIVRAAAALQEYPDIEFILVGKGLEHRKVQDIARRLGVVNIRFIDWLPFNQLPLEIANADICLGGHFSGSDKAKRVIAGKTFQFLAMRKPVIVGNCNANRELLTQRINALFVDMSDSEALAEGVLELRKNKEMRERLGIEGYRLFLERCNSAAISSELMSVISGYKTHDGIKNIYKRKSG
jgi:glycosyltransferase involved in cell wall biosynthesis